MCREISNQHDGLMVVGSRRKLLKRQIGELFLLYVKNRVAMVVGAEISVTI